MWKAFGVVAALLASATVAAGDEQERYVAFSAHISVAADGRATIGELTGPTGALAQAIEARLAETRFAPAKQDGAPVVADALVHGRAVLVPVNADEYEISLRGLTTRPAFRSASVPIYAPDRVRAGASGTVELLVHIDARGHVRDTTVVSSSHPSFTQSVLSASKPWHFGPQVGDISVVVPIIFRNASFPRGNSAKPKFECALDESRPNVVGDTGCTDFIEVVGTQIRR
ncbi:TonB family protein [Lysobacter sp. P5_B9]